MDFFQICVKEPEAKKGKEPIPEVYPDFKVGRSKDLMVRGRAFYAIWDEKAGLWSTDEYDVQRLVDEEMDEFAKMLYTKTGVYHQVKYLRSASSGTWYQFRKYLQHISDNSHQLDATLTFANTNVKKDDYISRRLPYPLEAGSHAAWDELAGTLYSVEERQKIEWIIGAIVAGEAKTIQKFGVFYGPPASGKGTILAIIEKLFDGYFTTFDGKALGSSNNSFATEVFKDNPLVAIQQDGDLSRIEDNARLNSIVSHENMAMNEKFKAGYTAKVNAFLLMGTNQPVKISDAKSGIIRRLIDIHPTGVTVPPKHYHVLMSQIDFELGAIAHHCLETFRAMGRNYYSGYRPLEMMFQTDIFFNFIEAYYDVFKAQDGTTLKQAYAMYKEWCEEDNIPASRVLPQYKFREELRNYFDDWKSRVEVNGTTQRSVYSGFNANKFKAPTSNKKDHAFSLVLEETTSIFDDEMADQRAQYWRLDDQGKEMPKHKWANVTTSLRDIRTNELHFVQVPTNHIVIDFDLKDENGDKSLEANLEAASSWPPTYAEISQGGNGVHLHYTWEGDVSELAAEYSVGIEVKTLLGDASLRRRLTRCNNVPIATINTGLPLKEKTKLLGDKTMKSEKGLRDLIDRALHKKINSSTKSNMDFIKHILDEAYETGMQYDVSDLRGKIMAFANNSSHNALYCLGLMREMKWASEISLEGEDPGDIPEPKDDRVVFFDLEVYPNLFIICWKFAGDSTIIRMINPSPAEVGELFKLKLIGYNNRRYDNHIMWARYLGYTNEQLYNLSQKIISNERTGMFSEAYKLSYADIFDFSSEKKTLKKFMIELGLPHVEMDLPWDQPVPEDLIPKVVDYCCNDVSGTEGVFNARKQDFIARQILAELSGLTVNDTTQRHTAKIIFGDDRNPQSKFKYRHLEEDFPGYDFDFGKSTYHGEIVGEGGYVYAEEGMYENVVVLDVASMHPTSIEQLNLFGEYTPRFAALTAARLAIKHKDYDSAKEMLDGKLAPYLTNPGDAKALSYALKIVINIVYGLTSAKFDNPFRDLRNKDNIVAKRGALFMVDLKNAVQERGFKVVHIKTDSIKIPNATDEIIDFVTKFGEKWGYTFEHEATYEKFCLVNDAVYIAKYGWHADDETEEDPAKHKAGTWDATGAQFAHPYVFKTLFSHEPVKFDDLCETKQLIKGAMYLDFQHDKPEPMVERMQFIGKTGRYVPVTESSGGAVLYKYVDGKFYAVAGSKGHLWVEADTAKFRVESGDLEVDMSYFEKIAVKAADAIWKFGDFDWFVGRMPMDAEQPVAA